MGLFIGTTNLVSSSSLPSEPCQRVIDELYKLNDSPRGSVHQRLQRYQILTEKMIKSYCQQTELVRALLRELDVLNGGTPTQHRKRWNEEDDLALIEAATYDETLITLALNFNRTPAAITSRLSYLVGIRRISREIAGHLIGYLDGEPVDGEFQGQLS